MLEQVANVTKMILPFSVSSKDRTLRFSEEMEKAIILYLTESDRKKSEGLILKKQPEKIVFIAKSHYPVWLVPSSGKTLLFDGLGVSNHVLTYENLPEVKTFIDQVTGAATKRQAYLATLRDHAHYFESAKSTEARTIEGLVTDLDLIQDFHVYVVDAEEISETEIREKGCLPLVIGQASISAAMNERSEIKKALESDMQILRDAMKLLNATTRNHVNAIRDELKQIQSNLDEKILAAKSAASNKVRLIQEVYDSRILKSSKRFERQLQLLHQDRAKLEMKLERAFEQIKRCDAEVLTSKSRRDARVEERWREEREKWKRESNILKKSIESLDKQIRETESQKNVEIANVRAEFNAESEEAMKEVRELEANRESNTKLSEQEIRALEDLTSALLGQLENLSKQKKLAFEQLEDQGMKEHRRTLALAYLPFYTACFQAGPEQRYVVFSPSIVGNMKTMTRLKSMFGVSKAKSLFQPRSRALANFMNQVVTLREQDLLFKRELHDFGVRTNILQTPEFRERISKGVGDLRNEEWISDNEVRVLVELLKAY